MAEAMQVELVSADRSVWSGEARQVNARTTEGDLGGMSDHTPVMSVLVPGVVEVIEPDGVSFQAAVAEGFISVADNRVSVLSESITLRDEIDIEEARAELAAAEDDLQMRRAIDRKSTRLNSSHVATSYAVFCLKKKKMNIT